MGGEFFDAGRAQWEIFAYLVAAAGVTWAVIVPAYRGIRDERRRRAVAKELAAFDALKLDWPALLAARPQVRAAVQRERETLARVLAVRPPQPRLELVDGEADAHISRVMAYRRELAADGKSLDDLRLE